MKRLLTITFVLVLLMAGCSGSTSNPTVPAVREAQTIYTADYLRDYFAVETCKQILGTGALYNTWGCWLYSQAGVKVNGVYQPIGIHGAMHGLSDDLILSKQKPWEDKFGAIPGTIDYPCD